MNTHDKRPRVHRIVMLDLEAKLDDPDDTVTSDRPVTDQVAQGLETQFKMFTNASALLPISRPFIIALVARLTRRYHLFGFPGYQHIDNLACPKR